MPPPIVRKCDRPPPGAPERPITSRASNLKPTASVSQSFTPPAISPEDWLSAPTPGTEVDGLRRAVPAPIDTNGPPPRRDHGENTTFADPCMKFTPWPWMMSSEVGVRPPASSKPVREFSW
jgi:hypothetical protein